MNAFGNETCLNVKHQHFIFQQIVQIYLNTYWYTPVRLHQSLKQHIGQVFFHQQHFLIHKQTSYTKHVLLVL